MGSTVERLRPKVATGTLAGSAAPVAAEVEEPLNALAVVNDTASAELLAAIFETVGGCLVRVGDLNLAAEIIAGEAECPPLLVLDISGADDPIGHLEQIAQTCPAGTGVVLVGDSDDPMLHHELQAMGVAHYLVKPVNHDHLLEAIRRADPTGRFDGEFSADAGNAAVAETSPENDEPVEIVSNYVARPKLAPAPAPAPRAAASTAARSGVRIVSNQPARETSQRSVAAPAPAPTLAPAPAPAPAPVRARAGRAVSAQPPASAMAAGDLDSLIQNVSNQEPVAHAPAPAPARLAPVPLAQMAPAAGSDPISRRVLQSYAPVNTMQDSHSGKPAQAMPMDLPVADFASVAALPNVEPLPRNIDLMAFLTDETSASLVTSLIAPYGTEGRVLPGNLETAVTMLRDIISPKLLIVDISGMAEPLPLLDSLAEVCAPGTSVVVVGEANDVSLYRSLKGAGVSEYVVKPLVAEALTATILNSVSGEAEQAADQTKPVLFVVGARGGAGSSTLSISIGGELVNRGKRVVLVDLDLQYGSIALALDTQPGQGLREVLESPDRLDSMFLNSMTVKVSENLFILAGEEGVAETIGFHPESLGKLISELTHHYDAIVVDLPRSVISSNWNVLALAHYVLILSDLSLVGIRDTSRLIAAAKGSIDGSKIKLVLSGAGSDGAAKIDRKEFEAVIKTKVDFVLPHDSKALMAAQQAARPVVNVASSSKLADTIRNICNNIFSDTSAEVARSTKQSFWRRRRDK